MHIDTITPVLPRSGNVEITGTVTNVSEDTYTRINVHAFSSANPILDSVTLVDSAASEPDADVGPRVTVPDTFYTVAELAPGQTAYFADSVPVDLLEMDPTTEGVYWIGVHALGDGAVPRDAFADGRARTFIPARPSSDAVAGGVDHPPIRSGCGSPTRARSAASTDGSAGSRRTAASTACSTWPTPPTVRRTAGSSTPPCSSR